MDFFPEAEQELVEMHCPVALPTVHEFGGLDELGWGEPVAMAEGPAGRPVELLGWTSQPKHIGLARGKEAVCGLFSEVLSIS